MLQSVGKPGSAFFGTTRPLRTRQHRLAPASRGLAVQVLDANCLIVNTKGGGHAFLGLHLAKKLVEQGHYVTILNDGDKAKLSKKAPFSEYSSLPWQVEVVWGNPKDPSTYPQGSFDAVFDNNGKDLATCRPLIDHFQGKVRNYVFVGSAGAYKADDVEPMHMEGDARKASAGHVEVETYLQHLGMPFTVFQPLYIYGPHTAKDCEQWFMDRILRGRPVPIPAPGVQLTSISHVEDLADMMARVPGNWDAVGQHFNLCSDRCISFVGIAKAIAEAAGKDAEIVLYDPKALKLGKGEGFPFRAVHFFASADKAKRVLGWKPQHNFLKDVNQLVSDYKASGRLSKDIDFSADDRILAAVGKSVRSSPGWSASAGSGALDTSQYSAEQLAFLERKRAGSVQPAGGNGGKPSAQGAANFSQEQLAFLERKRAASASPSPAPVRAGSRVGAARR